MRRYSEAPTQFPSLYPSPVNTGPSAAAQLRGAFVGSASGAVSVAGHALGGGHASLGSSALALLLVACAAVGTAAASLSGTRHPLITLLATLAAGQVVGHTALVAASTNEHAGSLSWPMLGAHAGAVVISALLIRAAERGALIAVSALRRAVPALPLVVYPAQAPAISLDFAYRPSVIHRLLAGSGSGTRGPPPAGALHFS